MKMEPPSTLKRQTHFVCIVCGVLQYYEEYHIHPVMSIQEYAKRIQLLESIVLYSKRKL